MNAGSLFAQAAGLALLGAVYPPAMLVAALYLGSERPGRSTLLFVVGGLATVTVIGIAALLAIRAGGLSHVSHHKTRYGLRLGLGVAAIIAAIVLYRRRSRAPRSSAAEAVERAEPIDAAKAAAPAEEAGSANPAEPAEPGTSAGPTGSAKPRKPKKPSLIQRLTAHPRPLAAFAVGAVMFGPSLTFIAAVQVIAAAKTSLADTVSAMAMIIVLTVAFAWLPLVAYLIAPARTLSALRTLEAWLSRHGKTLATAAVGLVGVILLIQGITGLT